MWSGYAALTLIHVGSVAVTFALFGLRGAWMLRAPVQLARRWVRIVPHIVDTVLLASAIAMAAMIGSDAWTRGWLLARARCASSSQWSCHRWHLGSARGRRANSRPPRMPRAIVGQDRRQSTHKRRAGSTQAEFLGSAKVATDKGAPRERPPRQAQRRQARRPALAKHPRRATPARFRAPVVRRVVAARLPHPGCRCL